jgi:hypothetical protein
MAVQHLIALRQERRVTAFFPMKHSSIPLATCSQLMDGSPYQIMSTRFCDCAYQIASLDHICLLTDLRDTPGQRLGRSVMDPRRCRGATAYGGHGGRHGRLLGI